MRAEALGGVSGKRAEAAGGGGGVAEVWAFWFAARRKSAKRGCSARRPPPPLSTTEPDPPFCSNDWPEPRAGAWPRPWPLCPESRPGTRPAAGPEPRPREGPGSPWLPEPRPLPAELGPSGAPGCRTSRAAPGVDAGAEDGRGGVPGRAGTPAVGGRCGRRGTPGPPPADGARSGRGGGTEREPPATESVGVSGAGASGVEPLGGGADGSWPGGMEGRGGTGGRGGMEARRASVLMHPPFPRPLQTRRSSFPADPEVGFSRRPGGRCSVHTRRSSRCSTAHGERSSRMSWVRPPSRPAPRASHTRGSGSASPSRSSLRARHSTGWPRSNGNQSRGTAA